MHDHGDGRGRCLDRWCRWSYELHWLPWRLWAGDLSIRPSIRRQVREHREQQERLFREIFPEGREKEE